MFRAERDKTWKTNSENTHKNVGGLNKVYTSSCPFDRNY